MRDLPVVLSGYKLHGGGPAVRRRPGMTGRGGQVVVTDRNGVTQFVVSLFVKQRVGRG